MSGAPTPPGWYPTPDGAQRYWDGRAWLDLPAPVPAGATGHASVSPGRRGRRWPWIVGGLASLVVVAVAIGATVVAIEIDAGNVEAAEVRASEAAEQEAADAEASREAQAAEDEARHERAERERRSAAVADIEASIVEMVEGHAADGLIDAPPLRAQCSPVGGSVDDLTARTTTFECFVSVEDLDDGTSRGFTYNALANWDSGDYTYGFGAP